MQSLQKLCLAFAAASLLPLIAGLATESPSIWQVAAAAGSVALAIGLGGIESLRGYQFSAWILASVVGALIYPQRFLHLGAIDLRNPFLILTVVQLVMFGMGTQMQLQDFASVWKMPRGVAVGIFCQFTVMPLVGFALTKLFSFPDEIAAGLILIGSCSSGLASNVMAYLSRANLPLSITLTAVATLLAPLMTPLWMKLLAGTLVEVSFLKMMMDIFKMVIVPIGAALLHDFLKTASTRTRQSLAMIAAAGTASLLWLESDSGSLFRSSLSPTIQQLISLVSLVVGAVVAGVVYHGVARQWPEITSWMPRLSMFGIVYFTAVTTSAGRNELLQVGAVLFLAAVIHNGLGYFFGYWLSRMLGMDRNSSRTIAFEVGLQNGGMAAGLAAAMGKLGTVGLAAAVFSPWMNISGSILANYWRKHPPAGKNARVALATNIK